MDERVLIPATRLDASRNAGIEPSEAAGGLGALQPAQFRRLEKRSATLLESLQSKDGDAAFYRALRRSPRFAKLTAGGVLLAAFLAGASTNYLGAAGVVNLISLPLFGLILWNLALYAVLLSSTVWKRESRDSGPVRDRIVAWLRNGVEKQCRGLSAPFDKAAKAFAAQWFTLSSHVYVKWIRVVAHWAAMALVVGVLAGMYLRGVAQEYRAGWESTFLDGVTLERSLSVILWPASNLTGIPVPPGKPMEALEFPDGGEKANRWIHLFAATAALFVLIPRTLLALVDLMAIRRLRRAARRGELVAGYYRRLSLAAGGAGQLVLVLPYHCRPEPRNRDAVRALIHALWGGAAHVDFAEPTPYGGEEELIDNLGALPGYLVLMMSLSATPEGEAHGHLIREIQKHARQEGDGCRILVLLDENHFRKKFGGLPEFERRLQERRKAWRELTEPLGIRVAPFNSDDRDSAGAVIDHAEQFVWCGS